MVMFFWLKVPFIRATIFLIAGILLFLTDTVGPLFIGLTTALTLVFLMVVHLKKGAILLGRNMLVAIAAMLLFMGTGFFLALKKSAANNETNLIHLTDISAYQGTITSDPQKKGLYQRATLSVEYTRANEWQKASGKVLIYIKPKDTTLMMFGDKLLIKGSPFRVQEPRNPHEFNYRKYLETKQIYHQQFVDTANWLFIESPNEVSLQGYASRMRQLLENQLAEHIEDPEALAIIKALVLGIKEDLSNETRKEFAQAGAMHVLAVSGLHVGIIYVILLLIINQSRTAIRKPWLVALIVIPVLWLYAFITGLSPSVLRAVTMFSLLSLGSAVNRRSSPFNSLAVSAFLLLVYDPFLVLSVSFQLSYIAVTGILLLYPMIERTLKPRARVSRFIWQLIALSIAAQLATAPLAAFYFHQFPTYFLLANLIVIPLATLLIWGGMFMISLGYIPVLDSLIGIVLSYIAQLMLKGIAAITSLPISAIPDLYPDGVEVLLVYGILATVIIFIKRRARWTLRISMFFSLMILFKLIFFKLDAERKRQIVFYDINNAWVIDFVDQQGFSTLNSDNIAQAALEYSVWPNRKAHKLEQSAHTPPMAKVSGLGTVVVWCGKTLLITNNCALGEEIIDSFDLVYYPKTSQARNCNLNQIHFRKLVIDETIIKAHTLDEEGSLVVNL